MENVRIAAGIVALAMVALLGAAILIKVYQNAIDLKYLLGDSDGDASMSRFQLLIFTFVVALSFLYLVMLPGSEGLPDVPGSVLTLLGISGTSYLVGKSMDSKSTDDKPAPPPPPPPPPPQHPRP